MELEGGTLRRHIWISVPLFALGGVLLSFALISLGIQTSATPIWLTAGIMGNVIGSFILGYLAFRKKTKDIVALFVPLYAVIILLLDSTAGGMFILQVLYAVSILILAIRLERRFS
jgi:hypothetical protein